MYIYRITNTKNKKCYIGQSVQKNNKRINNHRYLLKANRHSNQHLQYAWNVYGSDAFLFEKIAFATSTKELDELEKILIKEHRSDNAEFGYNIFSGGHHQHSVPTETRKLIGDGNRGKFHTKIQKDMWAQQKRINEYPEIVISPTGETYTVNNIREFCKTHDLDRANFMRVLKGDAYHTEGWRLPSTPIEFCDKRYISLYTQSSKSTGKQLISPDGVIYTIDKPLSLFCEEHGLRNNKIRAVLTKKQKHHKGWKLYEYRK